MALRSRTSINEAREDEEIDGAPIAKSPSRLSGKAEEDFKF